MANSTIYNGDCTVEMQKIANDSVDLILTDPPYNLGNFMINRSTNLAKMRENFFANAGWDNLEFDEWVERMDSFFEDAARIIKTGGSMIIFMSIIKVETIIKLAEKHGFYYKTTGIWHKLNPMPRNMNLHFVNSTEAWIYFTYKKKTGTFNNGNKMIHGRRFRNRRRTKHMIFSWIIKIALWALAGFLASKLVKGKPDGLLSNILLGLVGGIVGSFLFSLIGLGSINGIGNIIVSVIGACVVLFIVKKVAK